MSDLSPKSYKVQDSLFFFNLIRSVDFLVQGVGRQKQLTSYFCQNT
jgi:hypothetical protein